MAESIKKHQYHLASRENSKEDSIVRVGQVKIGGNRLVIIAGPCAVENREQIMKAARAIKESGAVILRAGAFKPRTSPYSFQGLGLEGLKLLREAGNCENLPVVSEVVSVRDIDTMIEYVDMFQVGARNMQNYELLKEIGQTKMPVLLKRGLSALIEEWLMAAEYIMDQGNTQVVLCERGIRSFETYTRNSLDLSSIPVIKNLSHLPVLVDPSHATGIRDKVIPMARASVAAGADGLMIEVHPDPVNALSDGAQSLFPEQFEKLMRDIEVLSPVVDKELARNSVVPLVVNSSTSSTAKILPTIQQSSSKTKISQKKSTSQSSDSHEYMEQESISIALQGEMGAYSEVALQRYFSSRFERLKSVYCSSFREVFEHVLCAKANYAVLPMENSLTGSIHENYDLLLQYPDICITGEVRIRIQHSLIALADAKIADISQVFSHYQAIAQCSAFLDTMDKVMRKPYYDTAASVAHVARQRRKDFAAIAHASAAEVYGLKVLREGIETNPNNYTRFVILQHVDSADPVPHQKASIVFSTPDKPGALLYCMKQLSQENLNLSKIESRPILGKPWEYMFYLDVDIEKMDEAFNRALSEIKDYSENLRILGIYSRG